MTTENEVKEVQQPEVDEIEVDRDWETSN